MDPIFEEAIAQMERRMNQSLAGLPPLEQIGLAQEAVYAIRACRSVGQDMADIFTRLRDTASKIEAKAEAKRGEIRAAVMAEIAKDPNALKELKLISMADHDTAITAARNEEKTRVDGEVNKQVGLLKQTAERRKKLVTDKVLTAVAAEGLPDELLQGDDFMTKVGKVGERLTKLATIKSLAGDPSAIARVTGMPVTAEGDQAFQDTFEIWEKAAKPGGTAAAPLNAPEGENAKKPVVLF